MFTYDLTQTTGNLYEKLYKLIKDDILSGNIAVGEKMPSKRTLALNLGVSTITVENAYDQLISEGYLYTLPKKGYYVSDITSLSKLAPKEPATYDIHMPENRTDWLFDFSSNKIDKNNFPFSIWAKLMRENISFHEDKLMEISPGSGVAELREAIAKYLSSFRGMAVDPRQIVVGAGTEYLYGLLVRLLGSDNIYCIENPGYKKIMNVYNSLGVECRLAGMDDKGIIIDELRKTEANIAHVSPTHHFPTGTTTPIDRRYELLVWANEQAGRYIIEDDYDSEFRINGKPIPPLQSIDACEKVIYMNTFSKSLTSTIRISYMILPVHLANMYYEKLSFYACTVSTFEQYTLAAFINQGYFEKHINRMRLHYGKKRKAILKLINNVFNEDEVRVVENDSGLHFILEIKKVSYSVAQLKNKLLENGICLYSIDDYNMLNAMTNQHKYIINYSNIEIDKAEKYFIMLRDIIKTGE